MDGWNDDDFLRELQQLGEDRCLQSFVLDLVRGPRVIARHLIGLGLDRQGLSAQEGRAKLKELLRIPGPVWFARWTDPAFQPARYEDAARDWLRVLQHAGVETREGDEVLVKQWIVSVVMRLPSPWTAAVDDPYQPPHLTVIFLCGQSDRPDRVLGKQNGAIETEDERRWQFIWENFFNRNPRVVSDRVVAEALGIPFAEASAIRYLTPSQIAEVLNLEVESVLALLGTDPSPIEIAALAPFGFRQNVRPGGEDDLAAAARHGDSPVRPKASIVEQGFARLIRRLMGRGRQ